MEEHVGGKHEEGEEKRHAQDQEAELAHADLEGIRRPAPGKLRCEPADARLSPCPGRNRSRGSQVLLNNLLYDVSEMGVPFDRVDESALSRPAQWSTALIERFMLVLGPVSSLFDFLTFFVLLRLLGVNAALFQTG